jgi:hypothetical protein
MGSRLITVVLVSLVLVSCATTKQLAATGGSKADGVVEMSYQYGMFEQPEVEWSGARQTAAERCEAWGYERAERFGGQVETCNAYNGYGNCINATVTISYQCIGD